MKIFKLSYESRKSLYGFMFILPWLIGALVLFLWPLVQSLYYSFCRISSNEEGRLIFSIIGFTNFQDVLQKNANFVPNLVKSLGYLLKVPVIIIFSMFVASILNQKFKGRVFVRAVFFLPVIIATGPVISIVRGDLFAQGADSTEKMGSMLPVNYIGDFLTLLGVNNLSTSLSTALNTYASSIFELMWNCGIPILIILAALQTVSKSAKEAAMMEGATSWEFFWKITLPLISPMILASLIYSIIDNFVDTTNPVMQQVLKVTRGLDYARASAMAWIYFIVILVVLGISVAVASKTVFYEND